MSDNACSLVVHPVTGLGGIESKLHKELITNFPSYVVNGTSKLYELITSDRKFLSPKGFGEWTDTEVYNRMINGSLLESFNEQGEPRVYTDMYDNPYTVSPKGDIIWLLNKDKRITSVQLQELTNTLAGTYIDMTPNIEEDLSGVRAKQNRSVKGHIKNTISKRIDTLKKDLDIFAKQLETTKDRADKRLINKNRIATAEKIDILNYIMVNKYTGNEGSTILDLLNKRVNAKLISSNFKVRETISDKESDEGLNNHEEIRNFTIESNQVSNRAGDDIIILKFLASIPKFLSYNENINEQNSTTNLIENALLGGPLYENPTGIRDLIETRLAGVINPRGELNTIFDEYVRILEEEAKASEHAGLNYIANYLKNIDNNLSEEQAEIFKIKFFGSMYKGKNAFVITIIKDIDGRKKVELIDPAETHSKVSKIASSFIETIITAADARIDITNARIDAYDNFRDNILQDPSFDKYIELLNNLLVDGLKLNLNRSTIYKLVKENSYDGFSSLNELLENFLNKEIKDSRVIEAYPSDYSIEGELDLIRELKGISNVDSAAVLKKFAMNNSSFIRALADAESIYKNDVSEGTIRTGATQRWLYSFMSTMDLTISKLKRDFNEFTNKFKGKNYTYVNYINKNPDIVDNIAITTNTEIKKEIDSNPVLHKNISEADLHMDILVKMFNSLDEHYSENTARKKGSGAMSAQQRAELSNYIMNNFGADKNSLYALAGLPTPLLGRGNMYNAGNQELGRDFRKVLTGYVLGELNRMKTDSEKVSKYLLTENLVEKQDYLLKNLVQDYHFVLAKAKDGTVKDLTDPNNIITDEEFQAGFYHKLGIFTKAFNKFLPGNEHLVYDTSNPITKNVPLLENSFTAGSTSDSIKSFGKLMETIYDDINEIIKSNHEYLSNIVATRKKEENEEGETEFIEETLFDIETNINIGDKNTAIYNYILSSFMVGYEFSNMFNGHISYYKQSNNLDQKLNDFLKRAHAPSANGAALFPNNKVEEAGVYYSLTEMAKKNPIGTPYNKNRHSVIAILNSINNQQSKYAASISKTRRGKLLSYAGEIADAQGYVTPEYFKKIVTNLYGWSNYDNTMYNQLNDRNHQVTDENIRWLKLSKGNTPRKLVHFEMDNDGLPIYLKYSIASLFPAIVDGSEVATLLKQMEKQGVDKVVFKSGSKGANRIPTTIHKMNGLTFDGLKENIQLNPFLITNEYTLEQTAVPTKLDTSIAMGNQAIKNILANLDMNSTEKNYFFRDPDDSKKVKAYTAKEIYDMITDTTKDILQTQLNRALNDLGYDRQTLQFNNRNIKNFLVGQMDLETEDDILKLLKTDLPLETIPNFTQRAFPVISSFIHDNAGKVYTNGSSVVQVANIGFDRLTNDAAKGVFFFDENNTELTPPIPIMYKNLNKKYQGILGEQAPDTVIYYKENGDVTLNPKEGKLRINKPKILLPFTSLFSKGEMSYEEFIKLYDKDPKKSKIDHRIFKNLIGYRIPNQSLSSNDSFEIVGILPPIAGDQAIVYHEITAKTGSDFDIDKMYLMLASFSTPKFEHNIPEEMRDLFDSLSKMPGFVNRDLNDFSNLPYMKDFSGNEILQEFVKNEEILTLLNEDRLKTDKKGIRANQWTHRPVGIILDNYDAIKNILDKAANNKSYDSFKYGDIIVYLTTVLDDLKESHNAQAEYINSFNTPENRKIVSKNKAKFYQKYGEVTNKEFNYVVDDSYHGQKNKLIELFGAILESETSYDDLISPLDNPIIKQTIEKIAYMKDHPENLKPTREQIKEYMDEIAPSGLEQMFPVSLVKARVDVLEAKSLISIMANNMSDLGFSQKAKFSLKYPVGFENNISFARTEQITEDGKSDPEGKLTKIISYLMNSAVDAAKDDYIIQGNFNTYSANAAMMITRLGISTEDIFTILMNDTIMTLAREKGNSTAKITDIITEYTETQLDDMAIVFLNELRNTKNNSVFEVISKEDFLRNEASKEKLIRGFWHLLSELGKEFNNSVVATKPDSNGPGKNISEMVAYTNRLARLEKDGTLNSDKKLFTNGLTSENTKFNPNIKDNKEATYLGALYNNSLLLMRELSKQVFIEASDAAIEAVNTMSAAFGNPLPTSAEDISLNYNYLYPSLLIQTGNEIYNINEATEEWLLNDFPGILQQYKNAAWNEDNVGNMFLNELMIDSKAGKIEFPRTKEFSPETRMLLKEAITDIMDKPMFGDVNVMDALVQFSFLTSGFKSTLVSFHDLIPANYFINKGHGTSVKNFINKYNINQVVNETTNDITKNSIAVYNSLPIADAMTLIAMNNHNSFKVVKKLGTKDKVMVDYEVTDPDTIEKLTIYTDLDGNKSFYPFLKKGKKLLLMLEDATDNVPQYTKIQPIDTKDTRLYSFNNLDNDVRLFEQNIQYVSKSSKLYRDIYPELTQEMWDSMSEEEQINFNDCR